MMRISITITTTASIFILLWGGTTAFVPLRPRNSVSSLRKRPLPPPSSRLAAASVPDSNGNSLDTDDDRDHGMHRRRPPLFPSPKVTSETPIGSQQCPKNQSIMEARSYLLDIEMAAEKARDYVNYLGSVASFIRDVLMNESDKAAFQQQKQQAPPPQSLVLDNVQDAQGYLAHVEQAEASALEYLQHLEDMAARTKEFLSKFEHEYNNNRTPTSTFTTTTTQQEHAGEAQVLYHDLEEEARAARDYLTYLKRAAASLQQFLRYSQQHQRSPHRHDGNNDNDEIRNAVTIPSVKDAQALCGLEGFQDFVSRQQQQQRGEKADGSQSTTTSSTSVASEEAAAAAILPPDEKSKDTQKSPTEMADTELQTQIPHVNGAVATDSSRPVPPPVVPASTPRHDVSKSSGGGGTTTTSTTTYAGTSYLDQITKSSSSSSSSPSTKTKTTTPKTTATSKRPRATPPTSTSSYLNGMAATSAGVTPKRSNSGTTSSSRHSFDHGVHGVTSDSLLPRNGVLVDNNRKKATSTSSSSPNARMTSPHGTGSYLDQMSHSSSSTTSTGTSKDFRHQTSLSSVEVNNRTPEKDRSATSNNPSHSYLDQMSHSTASTKQLSADQTKVVDSKAEVSDSQQSAKLGSTGSYLDQMSSSVDSSMSKTSAVPKSTPASYLETMTSSSASTSSTSPTQVSNVTPKVSTTPNTFGSYLDQMTSSTTTTTGPTDNVPTSMSTTPSESAGNANAVEPTVQAPTHSAKSDMGSMASDATKEALPSASAAAKEVDRATSVSDLHQTLEFSAVDNPSYERPVTKVAGLGRLRLAHPSGTQSYMEQVSAEDVAEEDIDSMSLNSVPLRDKYPQPSMSEPVDASDSSIASESPTHRAMDIPRIAHPGTKSFVEKLPSSTPPRKAEESIVTAHRPATGAFVSDELVESPDGAAATEPPKKRKSLLNFMQDLVRGNIPGVGDVDNTASAPLSEQENRLDPNSSFASETVRPESISPASESKDSGLRRARRSVRSYFGSRGTDDPTMASSDRKVDSSFTMETDITNDPEDVGQSNQRRFERSEDSDSNDGFSGTTASMSPRGPTSSDISSSVGHEDTDMRGRPLSFYGFSSEWPPKMHLDDGSISDSMNFEDGSAVWDDSSFGHKSAIPPMIETRGASSGTHDMRGRPLSDYGFSSEWPPKMDRSDGSVSNDWDVGDDSSVFADSSFGIESTVPPSAETRNANADVGTQSGATDMRGRPLSFYGFSSEWPPKMDVSDGTISGSGSVNAVGGSISGGDSFIPTSEETRNSNAGLGAQSSATDLRGRPLSDYGFSSEWPPKMVVEETDDRISSLYAGDTSSSVGATRGSNLDPDVPPTSSSGTPPGTETLSAKSGTGDAEKPGKRLVFKGFADKWPYAPIMVESDDSVSGNLDSGNNTGSGKAHVDDASALRTVGGDVEGSSKDETKRESESTNSANVSDGTHNFRGFSEEWPPKMFLSDYEAADKENPVSVASESGSDQAKSSPKKPTPGSTAHGESSHMVENDAGAVQEQSRNDAIKPSDKTENSRNIGSTRSPGFVGFAKEWPPKLVVSDDDSNTAPETAVSDDTVSANAASGDSSVNALGTGSTRSPGFLGFAKDWPPKLVLTDDESDDSAFGNAFSGKGSTEIASDTKSTTIPITPEIGSKYGLPRSPYSPKVATPSRGVVDEVSVSSSDVETGRTDRGKTASSRDSKKDEAPKERDQATSPDLDRMKSILKSPTSLKGPPRKAEHRSSDFHSDQTASSRSDSPPGTKTPNRREPPPTPLQVDEPGNPRADPARWSRAFNSLNTVAEDERLRFMAEQYILLVKKQLGYPRLIAMKTLNGAAVPSTWEKHVEKELFVTPDVRQHIVRMSGTVGDVLEYLFANAESKRRVEMAKKPKPNVAPPPAKALEEERASASPVRDMLSRKKNDVSPPQRTSETPSRTKKPMDDAVSSKGKVTPAKPVSRGDRPVKAKNHSKKERPKDDSLSESLSVVSTPSDVDCNSAPSRGSPSSIEEKATNDSSSKELPIINHALSEQTPVPETSSIGGSTAQKKDMKSDSATAGHSVRGRQQDATPRHETPSVSVAPSPTLGLDTKGDASPSTMQEEEGISLNEDNMTRSPTKKEAVVPKADSSKSKHRRSNGTTLSRQKGTVEVDTKPAASPVNEGVTQMNTLQPSVIAKHSRQNAAQRSKSLHASGSSSQKRNRDMDSTQKARPVDGAPSPRQKKVAPRLKKARVADTLPPKAVPSEETKAGGLPETDGTPARKPKTDRRNETLQVFIDVLPKKESPESGSLNDGKPLPPKESKVSLSEASLDVEDTSKTHSRANGTPSPSSSKKGPHPTEAAEASQGIAKLSPKQEKTAHGRAKKEVRNIDTTQKAQKKASSRSEKARSSDALPPTKVSSAKVGIVTDEEGTRSPELQAAPDRGTLFVEDGLSPQTLVQDTQDSKALPPKENVSSPSESAQNEHDGTSKSCPRVNGARSSKKRSPPESIASGKDLKTSNATEVAEKTGTVATQVAVEKSVEAVTAPDDYLDPLESMLKVFGMKLPWSSEGED